MSLDSFANFVSCPKTLQATRGRLSDENGGRLSTMQDAEITPCYDAKRMTIIRITSSLGKTHEERTAPHPPTQRSHYTWTPMLCHSCSIKNAFRYRAPLSRERERERERGRGRETREESECGREGRNRSGGRFPIED